MTTRPAAARAVATECSPASSSSSAISTCRTPAHLGQQPSSSSLPPQLSGLDVPPGASVGGSASHCSAEHPGTSPAPRRLENHISRHDYTPVPPVLPSCSTLGFPTTTDQEQHPSRPFHHHQRLASPSKSREWGSSSSLARVWPSTELEGPTTQGSRCASANSHPDTHP